MNENYLLLGADALSMAPETNTGNTGNTEEMEGTSSVYPSGSADTFLNHALPTIGWAMLGTFAVIAILICATVILNKVTNRKRK